MSEIIEHRCKCCGHIYKHNNDLSYIALCPNCKNDGFYLPYNTEVGIMPCRIFLGEEKIGKMISISKTCNKIVSDKFDICEYINDSPNPYLEAIDLMCYKLEPNKLMRLKERLKRQYIRENTDISDNDNLNIVFVQAIVEVMKRVYKCHFVLRSEFFFFFFILTTYERYKKRRFIMWKMLVYR